jgi:hypothetical protein
MQEVGQKEIEKKPPRKDTGKIASLSDSMKKEILELRRLGDSGASIKSSIENMIDASDDPNIKYDLHGKGILKNPSGAASLNVTGQALTDWAKARGVESRKKRKTMKEVETAAKEISEKQFKIATEKLSRLQVENKTLKDQLTAEKKSHVASDEIRTKLRDENYILREKLKSVKVEKSAISEMQIEIDLSKVERGLREERVKVVRGGKTFYRKQRVGRKEVEGEEKPKELAIIGLNKPKPEEKPKLTEATSIAQAKKSMGSHVTNLRKTPEGNESLDRIESYTGGDYKSFNEYLRTGKMAIRDLRGKISIVKPSKVKKVQRDAQIDKVSDFLKNAPKIEGTVYRGMMWKQDKKSTKEFNDFIDKMVEGSEITFPTFSSTSTDESTATEFATLASKKEPVHSVVIEMRSKNGVYLNGASAFEVENEVLFDRDSKFTVAKVDKKSDPIRIILTEA